MLKLLYKGVYIVFVLVNLADICASTKDVECGAYDQMTRSGLISNELWPKARVPYEFVNLRPSDIQVFMQAIQDIESHTCINFVPRKSSDHGYIKVIIKYPPVNYCGAAGVCFNNNSQELEIAHDCSNVNTFVHELCHSLCLHHEQVRPDRDDFLSFEGCPPGQVQAIRQTDQLRGYLYDYNSVMHYRCYGKCSGSPTMKGVFKCGGDVNPTGLSIMDADKINEYYDCRRCHRHRWYNTANLTANQRDKYLVNFGSRDGDKQPVYACRAYTNGNIGIGTYDHAEKACVLEGYEQVFVVKKHVQLFGIYGRNEVVGVGKNLGEDKAAYTYQLLEGGLQSESCKTCVAAGRYGNANYRRLFIAVTEVDGEDGKKQSVVGHIEDKSRLGGFVVKVNGERLVVFKNELDVLHCI